MADEKCPKCNGEMIDGKIIGTFGVPVMVFSKEFKGFDRVIKVRGRLCTSCGYLESYVDTEMLQKKLANK